MESLWFCFSGTFGQIGHGENMSLSSPAKVSYFVDKSVKMVACGMRHSLVLFAGNQVRGFGSGKRVQLGFSSDRTKSVVNFPCVVSGLEDVEVVLITANGDHSAAISVDGEVCKLGKTLNKQSQKQQLQPLLEKVPGFDGVKVPEHSAVAKRVEKFRHGDGVNMVS